MFARFLICCLLALSLPLQAQARAGFFICVGEAPSHQACAEHQHQQTDVSKKATPQTHCAACVIVAMTSTPLIVSVSDACPTFNAALEPASLGVIGATPQPPPKALLA